MLTSLFWTTYITDIDSHLFKLTFLVVCLAIVSVWWRKDPNLISTLGLFAAGYIVADPFCYYFVRYLSQ